MSRNEITREKLIEMVQEGLLDRDMVIMAFAKYMSEADIADMCRVNDIVMRPSWSSGPYREPGQVWP